MEIGQKVKVKFETSDCTEGEISYIHSENRYVCVKAHSHGGDITEAFKPWEVSA